jgi:mannosylglycoprotein endo-beta-mannosidase
MSPQSPKPADFNSKYALSPQDGPYGILYPHIWYQERNPGLAGYNQTPVAFNPEVGSVSCPTDRSMRRFLSEESMNNFPKKFSSDLNDTWGYHKYISFTTAADTTNVEGDYDFIYSYGPPDDIEEYSIRAQLVQYEQYRALFEGYRLHQWEYYNAVIMWKSQSPWPTFRGALYDYYLEQTGGFFGVKKALLLGGSAEFGGLHVQLNPRTLEVDHFIYLFIYFTFFFHFIHLIFFI